MSLIADTHAQLEATQLVATTEAANDDHHAHAEPPAFYSVIPFAALLLCIAFLPLIHKTEEWWEHNKNRLLVAVSLGLGHITLLHLLVRAWCGRPWHS